MGIPRATLAQQELRVRDDLAPYAGEWVLLRHGRVSWHAPGIEGILEVPLEPAPFAC
jgi:hypothetical protein